MNLFSSISDLKNLSGPIVLVGGTFDGVHLGHQALIKRAQEEARRVGGKVVVMTFDRHPAALLRPAWEPPLLTPLEQKLKLIQELEVDAVLLLTFDEQLAAIPATEFITQLTEALPKLKTITVGASWSFGKGGEGNLELLKTLGEKFHFSVLTINSIEVNGSAVSSTRIRRAIGSGELEEAAACLGRRYSLTGTVIEGNKKAREFGFPTANLLLPRVQIPPDGVYAVLATVGKNLLSTSTDAANNGVAPVLASSSINDTLSRCAPSTPCSSQASAILKAGSKKKYQGAANIGHCPTISDFPFPKTVEVHLFDFEGDLYGQQLTMEPVAYLRPEIKFPSLEELRLQIVKDVAVVKEILKKKNI